jgi:hypothetical protein
MKHEREATTPMSDGTFLVDCACGDEYSVPQGGNELAALEAAQKQHKEEVGGMVGWYGTYDLKERSGGSWHTFYSPAHALTFSWREGSAGILVSPGGFGGDDKPVAIIPADPSSWYKEEFQAKVEAWLDSEEFRTLNL